MNESIKPWENDVNVLIIFFIREDVLEKTFDAVRQARPRRLLLWQDGARDNHPDDMEKIRRCRQIVENVDWDCEVYKNYQTKNWGCDPSTFYSHKWAFSIVDKCVILEDDCVPSQSFFYYCKELLDKYENDSRIGRICGMCQVDVFDNYPYDYTFASFGSVGWATWKRVADLWEEDYGFLDDSYAMRLYLAKYRTKRDKNYLLLTDTFRRQGVAHWEQIQSFARVLNSQLCIIPTRNLVHNIGLGIDSTHSNVNLKDIPKRIRTAFYSPAVELDRPIRHPKYVIQNMIYEQALRKVLAPTIGDFFRRLKRLMKRLF